MNVKKENGNIHLIPKSGKYTHVIMFMHGFGDSPESYLDFFKDEVKLPSGISAKVILLKAPTVPSTMMGGFPANSWFDITQFPIINEKCFDFKQAQETARGVEKLIDNEAKLIGGKYANIFVGGFSQGACLSLYIGLSYQHLIGGVICCSGVLFPQTKILESNKGLKAFIGHGKTDNIIPFDVHRLGMEPIDKFPNIDKHYYEKMDHTMCDKEIEDISNFLKKAMV